MKSPLDPRHQRRKACIQALFSWGFGQKAITNPLCLSVIQNQEAVDDFIQKSAPEWPIQQINRLDLAILRLAVYELAIAQKEPPKVIIDEAVELAKEFGSESSPAFVNGCLGAVLSHIENKSHD